MSKPTKHLLLMALLFATACNGAGSGDDLGTPRRGQTDFISEEFGGSADDDLGGEGSAQAGSGGGVTAPRTPTLGMPGAPPPSATPVENAPGGRVAEVEEADIYKVDGNRLFYLNTYRGFVVYDLTDPKKPARLSRLPVFGHPVEMFVAGNTVYALLKDALYLSQSKGALTFERHNVSQLVAIDISDPRAPKVLETIDIAGQLREGVSRKVQNSIYVVSHEPQGYQAGWRYNGQPDTATLKEQAWVYSFDVSNPAAPKLVDKERVFESGNINYYDQQTGASFNRHYNGFAMSATSNALMVVENWQVSQSSGSGSGSRSPCSGGYSNAEQAIVSIIDISNPNGDIAVHTKFETVGRLGDQFKMTYVHDEAAKTGTFYGIFIVTHPRAA